MPNGTLQIYASIAGQSAPLPGVEIAVYDNSGMELARVLTDETGASPSISLEAPDKAYSLDESNTAVRPYATYDLYAFLAEWQPLEVDGVQIFDGQEAVARLEFIPADDDLPQEGDPVIIPEHPLFAGGGGSARAPVTICPTTRVLQEVVIPKKITVHLGKPAVSARDVTVTFQHYIANVASSEVYPTWVERKIHAISTIGCAVS